MGYPLPPGNCEVQGALIAEGAVIGAFMAPLNSTTADAVASSGTISTTKVGVARVSPTAAVTGVILQPGSTYGQECWVINEATSANSVTFAASATSNVAGGTSVVIAGAAAAHFLWDAYTNLWYSVQ